MKKYLIAITATLLVANLNAQTLFTYGGTPVDKSEFLRMYLKNNFNKKADMSSTALNEYVKLYSRFKMKVAEARLEKIDTLPNIASEFGQYKKQLATSFLTDRDVLTTLSKEAYERLKKDVNVAHIMISVPQQVGTDSTPYFNKVDSVYKALVKGADFAQTAKAISDDKVSGAKGGDMGYFTALQVPYAFENVTYSTAVGKYSKPFRTAYGYHIVKKLTERPAKGQIQVAQILVAAKKSQGEEGKQAARAKIDSIYNQLKNGASWNELVKAHSEDKYTANSDGEMVPFTIAEMAPEFEQAAFALNKEGEISKPIVTDFGYHIIKFLKKMPQRSFEEMKGEIGRTAEKQGRVESAKVAFLEKIKVKNKFTQNDKALTAFINAIPDSAVANGQVTMPTKFKIPLSENLFTLKNTAFTQDDLVANIMQTARGKLYGTKDYAIRNAYKSFVEKALLDYEENNLYTENKEYANLLDEYKDGIMIFELTNKNVWGKASSDSVGLEKYFNKYKAKYMWAPSFEGTIVRISDAKVAADLSKYLNTIDLDSAITLTNASDKISTDKGRYEFNRYPEEAVNTAIGTYSKPFDNKDGSYTIIKPTSINMQAMQKELNDARGYVIADYQDYIEKEWIVAMEQKYPVKVMDAVFKQMVK
jgi:peptidyl-prolyl cis-trans isomerase SurA